MILKVHQIGVAARKMHPKVLGLFLSAASHFNPPVTGG
jgi:hypothetical protein